MASKNDYINIIRTQNPKPLFRIVNNEEIELTDDEYENAIEAWAVMRVEQDTAEQIKAAARQAVLDKLGLTADEITALFG